LIRWESINVGGYASQRTTKAYRHGRCYMCSKPVSYTNLDPDLELFCKECDGELIALDCGYMSGNKTNSLTKKGRGRIPIPQSDDESEGDTWIDESDGSDQERDIRPACVVRVETAFNRESNIRTMENKVNRQTTDDLAFRHGPRRDGTILMKDGSILNIYSLNSLNILKPEKPKTKQELPDETRRRPQWTSTLLKIQRLQLKMRYKNK
jgi:hypothetical protein